MLKKNLESLNVLDDFLFGKIVSDLEVGPEFCRRILEIILNRKIGQIKIIAQRTYPGVDPEKHGARLDVYMEEDGNAEAEISTVYDIEPDRNSKKSMVLALPKRVRFYHAKIDGNSLKSGEDYSHLKRVAVIMITTYDPFGRNRMIYTMKTGCVEEPEMVYDDGAVTLFLYTRGTQGNPPEELRNLLRYLEESKEENAGSMALLDIHRMVETVRQNEEVSLEYMKIFEREQMIRDDGIEEGKKEGIKEGEDRMIRLISCLLKDNRSADIKALETDRELRKRLLREYGL